MRCQRSSQGVVRRPGRHSTSATSRSLVWFASWLELLGMKMRLPPSLSQERWSLFAGPSEGDSVAAALVGRDLHPDVEGLALREGLDLDGTSCALEDVFALEHERPQ